MRGERMEGRRVKSRGEGKERGIGGEEGIT